MNYLDTALKQMHQKSLEEEQALLANHARLCQKEIVTAEDKRDAEILLRVSIGDERMPAEIRGYLVEFENGRQIAGLHPGDVIHGIAYGLGYQL